MFDELLNHPVLHRCHKSEIIVNPKDMQDDSKLSGNIYVRA